MPVLVRRAREVLIAAGDKTPAQKQRPGMAVVRDINQGLEKEVVVVARRLLSGDVLVTFKTEVAKAE